MFNDNDNENMNFDSLPDISFNNDGQPLSGNFGMSMNNSFSSDGPQSNGQFIPPMGMGVDENVSLSSSSEKVNEKSAPVNSSTKGDFNMFKCNTCNSTFGVSNGGIADECIMCHEHNMVSANYNGDSIESFIPFSISKNKAIQNYKSKVMLNPIIPISFKKGSTINSIKKVYVPGYLYDVNTSGSITLLGADQTPNGKIKYDVVFDDNVEHDNLFYKSSSKINDKVFNAISNYNFNNLIPFDPNNVGQSLCLDSDITQADVKAKVEDNCKKHVIAMTRKKVNHQLKKVQNNSLVTNIINVQTVLVPVYLLNVKYGGKDYMYVMNGETGESSLDVTNGILEMVIFGLLIALIVFLISYGISVLF